MPSLTASASSAMLRAKFASPQVPGEANGSFGAAAAGAFPPVCGFLATANVTVPASQEPPPQAPCAPGPAAKSQAQVH